MRKDYSEILKDPRWQKKRLEVLQAKGFKCDECGDEKKTLHVHHRYYVSHRNPWSYPDFCYQVLCKACHDIFNKQQPHDEVTLEDWEIGLDHFGNKVYEMAFEELCAADYDKAHGIER